jgi:hypothetical protein
MNFQVPKQFKIASLVLGFTVVTFIADVYLSTSFINPTEHIKQLISRCADTWKAGFGAFLGIIGGTAFSDSHQPADTKV